MLLKNWLARLSHFRGDDILACLEGELFKTDCLLCRGAEALEIRPSLKNFKGRKICGACAWEIRKTKTGHLLLSYNENVQALPYASLSSYDGKAKALILRLKSVKDDALVSDLAKLLIHPLGRLIDFSDQRTPPLLIPVPLHEARFKERGYNQSALLARALALQIERHCRWPSSLTFPGDGILVRARETASQQGLTSSERRTNMDGAFLLTGQIGDRAVVLIDDVLTSGATAGNCANAILKALPTEQANASNISVLTIARANWRQ